MLHFTIFIEMLHTSIKGNIHSIVDSIFYLSKTQQQKNVIHEFWHHMFNKTQWTLVPPRPPQVYIDRPSYGVINERLWEAWGRMRLWRQKLPNFYVNYCLFFE